MSYIPPLVCDTPPPIDFEDSHEDDFGDGMFSNYDGSSLPTTPKQSSSINDNDDLPIDIPELPDLPQFPDIIHTELAEDYQNSNEPVDYTDIPLPNVLPTESNSVCPNISSQFIEPIVNNCKNKSENSDTENVSSEIPKVETIPELELNSHSEITDVTKTHMKLRSLENSTSSQFNSNDNVYRGESPPSLVFSAESLNCDDNQSEDFEEFQQNNDEVECNFPSLKLDSNSDSKSQSSDLEETNNSADCELAEIRDDFENRKINSISGTVVDKVDSPNDLNEHHPPVTNTDDSFDDFVEYEANVAEEPQREIHEFIEYQSAVKPHQKECSESIEIKHSDENAFAADFSQFESFSEKSINQPVQCDINFKQKTDETIPEPPVPDSASSLAIDDFDDFKTTDDDDEFGEFNDFNDFEQSQTIIPSLTTNVEELTAKIKPLLDSLFPSGDNESEDSSYDALDLTNDTTKIIKDFENSKALDHQWISSVGKSSLVTALGIDSRNILYGGKWNSSMPRFAANLGFSPLEPIKPSSVSGTTSSTNSSVSNEIPAAQFDWNSSGLVNPLDASHAHTLLLDLEQLVVVANLDKIKLDSSTCSSTIPATPNSTTNNNSMSSLNNHYIYNCNADGVGYQYNGDFYGNSLPYSCETNIKTLDKNTNHFGLFDQFLDIRVQEILHKTNAAENQPSRSELDWHSTKAEPTLITQTAPLSNIHTTLNINANNFIDNDESTQTSASYVVPGSSGTLKETHIFTPSKSPYSIPQSRDVSNDKQESKCSDFDYEKAAAGIIIDENVVKKEYRDIEYDPDKPVVSTGSSDDFSDFQSVPIPITTQKPHQNMLSMDFGILQPTKRSDSITINWPDPGNVVNSSNLESFDNFMSAENVSANNNKRNSTDFGTNGKSKSSSSTFGEFSKPVIGVSPSETMFETNSSSLEDEFSDFQCVEPNSTQNKFVDVIPNYQPPPLPDVTPSKPTEILSHKSINASEAISTSSNTWSNYQPPKVNDVPITTNVSPTNILQPSPLKPLQILTPQTIHPQPALRTNTIWPESEIDPDEIARLEAIFPQAQKQSQPTTSSNSLQTAFESKPQNQNSSIPQEDDEWSDFVSVPTPASQPLPITNIISANIVKHQQDDDEWSDFVSSTSQASPQPWSYSSGPNFTSWNAPPQFDSWQSSTLRPQQFVPTLPTINNNPSLISSQQTTKTNPNSFFTPKAPSISLIPDLSFVAPKTLVNRSRTNYQSK